MESTNRRLKSGRVRTPTILQMEMAECGAAALGMILGYYGRTVPLVELRRNCGVSRDGSKASNVVQAARNYGLSAKGFKKDLTGLESLAYPYIVFWNFNHFLVVEGFKRGKVYLNDPAMGPRTVTIDEFDEAFTGVVLVMEPSTDFKKGGARPRVSVGLWHRLRRSLLPLAACAFAALLLVLPGLAIPAISQIFVDKVLVQGVHDWARPLIVGLLLTAILRAFLAGIQFRLLRLLKVKLAVVMSSNFVWHLLRLPAGYYAQRFSGEIASRISLNDRVADVLSGQLATTVIDLFMMLFYGFVMYQFDHVLTGIAFAFAALNFLVLRWVSRKRTDGNQKLTLEFGKLGGVAIAGLQSIRTIKASALESDFYSRWSGHYAKAMNAQQELSVANQYFGVVPRFLSGMMSILVLILGGLRVMDGAMSIGMLVAFQSLTASFLAPINSLLNLGGSMQELAGDIGRLDDVLNNPIQPAPVASAEVSRLQGYVEFRNVSFGYNPAAPPLIEDLSFSIRPGQRLALVGNSGSGKSTVAKLLCGLYEPVTGEILIDGVPRTSIPRDVLSNSLSAVDQDILLFGGTVSDNLTLWDSTVPETAMQKATSDALIHDAIVAMPSGYQNPLLEGAANMSGGQRQRLEIARALVNDPSILVLDEATSALDAETEMLVDGNIRMRGCSCVIVAHRLSTIRDCDEILVLESGKVVQRGTHDEMIRESGPYRTLISTDGEALSEVSILARKAVAAELRTVRGNEPLLVDGRTACIVESGALALFLVQLVNGVPDGPRRFLVRINAGEAMLAGLSANSTASGLLAVAVKEARVRSIPLQDLLDAAIAAQRLAIQYVQGWTQKIGRPLPVAQFQSSASLTDALVQAEQEWLEAVESSQHDVQEQSRQRLEKKKALNHDLTTLALGELAHVVDSDEGAVPSDVSGPMLLRAAQAVGSSQGIPIRAPLISDPRTDPIQAIIQASGVRARRVMLAGRWWTAEGAPLLGFWGEQKQPVALLPAKSSLFARSRYEMLNPADNSRSVVSEKLVGNLSPVALTLYRPFNERVRSLDLLRFVMQGRGKDLVTILLTGIAVTLLGMLTPQATAILVDQAIPDGDRALILQLGLGLLAASAGSVLFELAQSASMLRIEIGSSSNLQCGVWDRLLKLSPAFFRNYTTGDLASRANAINSIRQQLSGATLRTVFVGFAALLNLLLMTYYSPTLAGASVVLVLIVIAVTLSSGIVMTRMIAPLQEIEGQLFGLMVQLINGVAKLRVAAAEERAFAHWGHVYSREQKLKQGIQKIQDRVRLVNLVLPALSSGVIFWIVEEYLRNAGTNSAGFALGTFLAFNTAFGVFFAGATSLSDTGIGLLSVASLWKRARVILNEPPEVDSTKAHPGKLSGRMSMEHVTFRYREDGPLILDDLSIEAGAGECIALVGPSGSGKSTILNLLLRFEQPASGAIYFDGQSLDSLDIGAVRRQLGVVLQDNKIMAGSIFDNIVCGSLCTLDDAWEAARAAAFDRDVESMPMKMHTPISEGGGNISGGQRQRLLIARALVTKPSILIFDEATSALDNRTQETVTESLRQLKVTTILVAHRLSTIRHADRIYVIEAGRVVQKGTFDELAKQEGLFARLMARQMM